MIKVSKVLIRYYPEYCLTFTMRTFIIACAGLFLGANLLLAQNYVFKILVNKGLNQVKASNQSNWQQIKTGLALNDGDWIKVVDDAYLGLVHVSGRTKELVEAGTFEVEELSSTMGGLKKGIASKYTEFVFQRLADERIRDPLPKTGAVTRDIGEKIEVFMPTSSRLYDPEVIIPISQPTQKGQVRILTITDMFSVKLMEKETVADHFKVNLTDDKLEDVKMFFFYVSEKGNKKVRSVDFGLEFMQQKEAERTQAELNELLQELEPQTALGQVILAVYYEQNDLLIDALRSYWRAKELFPKVQEYRALYNSFVVRNELIR